MKSVRNIGIQVKSPGKECDDKHCPFHAGLKVRGRMFVGTIAGHVIHKTAKIQLDRQHYLPKYERFEKRRTRLRVHVTPCIDVGNGDMVKVMECRPIAKSKSFVVVEVMKNESV